MTPSKKDNLSAVRRMAAKKGGQIQFQIDVTNEEEWNKLLKKKGVIVVDVYSGWCGPCTAMVSTLKKFKLEIGSDILHFATAKSDEIQCLERFRNKSEPTWMIIANGFLVNLIFGVNAPKLIALIKLELENECKVLQGVQERKTIPFEQLTEEEEKRLMILKEKEKQKQKEEEEKLAKKMEIVKERSLKKLSNLCKNYSLIIFMPHTIANDSTCIIAQKMMYLYDTVPVVVVDQMQKQLDKDKIEQIFYNCKIIQNFHKEVLKSMEVKPILATLVQLIPEDAGISPRTTEEEIVLDIEQKLSRMIYGCDDPTDYTELSVAYEFIVEDENGNKLYPIWTPTNSITKAAAIELLFPRKAEDVGYAPEKLPPPQFIIIYEATKAPEIRELIKSVIDEIANVGYFDSADPHSANLVCKRYSELKDMPEDKIKCTKMVVSLKKQETDDILLEFSQTIPIYISLDEKAGMEESQLFFPFGYNDDFDVGEEYEQDPLIK